MNPTTRRTLIVLAICAVCTLAFAMLWSRNFVPLQQAEYFAWDWQMRLGRKTPLDDRLVLIGIDKPVYSSDFSDEEILREPVLRELQNSFPWSRAVWARLIEKLADAGAKVIVIDLVFAGPSEGDEELHQALEKYRDRVVIGYNINVGETDRGDYRELIFPSETVISPTGTESPVEDSRLGYVNIWPDFDDTLRRVSFRQPDGGVVLESLAARALRKSGFGAAVPEDFDSRLFRYTAEPGFAFKPCPVGEVLSPKLWQNLYADGKFFKDKIVLIGPTAEIFRDFHNTPFNDPKQMGGPEIHLQIMNAALHGEFPSASFLSGVLWVIALSGMISTAVCFVIRQPAKRLLGVVVLGGAYLVLAQLLFDHSSRIIPIAVPLMVLATSSLIVLSYDFVQERLERMKLRNTMGLYFSPRVLEVVLANPGSMEPRRADITMLLTDMRNSTPLAEVLSPQGMFDLLNLVFEAQIKAVLDEDATLEHFLGDQFLSYWGAPQPQPDGPDRALRAANNLITVIEALRPNLSPEVRALFGYGVALHSGPVLIGNKGSARRLDYGIVGDAVNEAARVEALTKYYGAKLLVTGTTFRQLTSKPMHRLLDRIIVKGKSGAVELFECVNPCTPPDFEVICQRYQHTFEKYARGCFAEAKTEFESLVKEFSDGPSKILVSRCAELEAHPPAEWKGIWKMDTK